MLSSLFAVMQMFQVRGSFRVPKVSEENLVGPFIVTMQLKKVLNAAGQGGLRGGGVGVVGGPPMTLRFLLARLEI